MFYLDCKQKTENMNNYEIDFRDMIWVGKHGDNYKIELRIDLPEEFDNISFGSLKEIISKYTMSWVKWLRENFKTAFIGCTGYSITKRGTFIDIYVEMFEKDYNRLFEIYETRWENK